MVPIIPDYFLSELFNRSLIVSTPHLIASKTQFIWCSNRDCQLYISTAPTEAKSREPAYSQALNSRGWESRPRVRQAGRQLDGYGEALQAIASEGFGQGP